MGRTLLAPTDAGCYVTTVTRSQGSCPATDVNKPLGQLFVFSRVSTDPVPTLDTEFTQSSPAAPNRLGPKLSESYQQSTHGVWDVFVWPNPRQQVSQSRWRLANL
jgi:hypothetical protein